MINSNFAWQILVLAAGVSPNKLGSLHHHDPDHEHSHGHVHEEETVMTEERKGRSQALGLAEPGLFPLLVNPSLSTYLSDYLSDYLPPLSHYVSTVPVSLSFRLSF